MKKHLLIWMIVLNSLFVTGQNLVPNGSFENYITLPCSWINSQSDFSSAMQNWVMPTLGTSDIYSTLVASSCFANCNSTISSFGNQLPRTGSVTAGFCTYGQGATNDYREYLEVMLTTPLISGQAYYGEFYVSRAEVLQFSTNNIGMYFSDSLINSPIYGPLNLVPQINGNAVISDTIEWVKISGTFIATSAAQYLIIGNFYNDLSTSVSSITNFNYPNGYYYIDDVSVTLATGINNINDNNFISVYPNPATTHLTIQTNNNLPYSVILYDIASRKIMEKEFVNTVTLNTETLSKGIYIYEVSDSPDGSGGVVKTGKVVKE